MLKTVNKPGVSVSSDSTVPAYEDITHIDISSVGLGAYMSTLTSSTSSSINSSYYTTGYISPTYNPVVDINTGGINIRDGGDITINGRSLSGSIKQIEERLAILHPNPELEERWEELKKLRQQYNSLEQELLEKEKMWNMLKK